MNVGMSLPRLFPTSIVVGPSPKIGTLPKFPKQREYATFFALSFFLHEK